MLAPDRTIGDDWGKLVSDLASTRLLAFNVHNVSLQVLSVSTAPIPNSGEHFLTMIRCFNSPSIHSNFL